MKYEDIAKKNLEEATKHGDQLFEKLIKEGKLSAEENALLHNILYTVFIKSLVREWISNMPMQQKELAEKVGVTPATICEYRKGKSMPSLPVFFMIAEIMNPDYVKRLLNVNLTVDEMEELIKSKNVKAALEEIKKAIIR